MTNKSRFGKLIGVLDVKNSSCKFLIYAVKNREILTCHDISINKIESSEDEEYDPIELWNAVKEAMRVATQNLIILDIEPNDIVAVGITNQRENSLLWNSRSGEVFNTLSNVESPKVNEVLDRVMQRTKNKKNYLRAVCGLPFDVCFSALKIRWLIENNKSVRESIQKKECYFGNLDSWILWNLTGGTKSGVHCTDVTNASRSMLMNLQTLEWDTRLCKFFDIPSEILPQIKSCSQVFGYILGTNILDGVPIASIIGNQNSALVGQICLKAGQIECHVENDCSVMINTGQNIIYSDNDLLTTVGFQLGPDEKVHYALEGFIGNSCTSIDWLKTSILPPSESNNNTDDISPVSNFLGMRNGNCFKRMQENELTFVPALKGLCAPRFLYQAKGFLSGITINTTSQQLLNAAKESICFQTKTILDSIRRDCKTWPTIQKIIVGGEFSENVDFLQLLANICCVNIERPQISAPTGLGCMLSAALTMKNLSLDEFKTNCVPPIDLYNPSILEDVSDQKYVKWLTAFKTSLQTNEQTNREEVDTLIDSMEMSQFIQNSIPGTFFLFSSYVIYVLSQSN